MNRQHLRICVAIMILLIKQADKGSAVVVMDKEAYLTEGTKQLDDKEIYQPLVKDPTKDMIKKVNARIKESYQKGNIDKDTQQYLMASGEERAGRFYFVTCFQKYTRQAVPDDQSYQAVIHQRKRSLNL